MTVTLTFPPPADRLSLNKRYHWSQRANLTRLWRTASFAAASLAAVDSQFPSFVRVTFPVATGHKRDGDNAILTTKAIVDGLVDAGVFPTDNTDWVETLGSQFEKGASAVKVEIIPRGELVA